jgi:outer membrane biosynthesis protein TonB
VQKSKPKAKPKKPEPKPPEPKKVAKEIPKPLPKKPVVVKREKRTPLKVVVKPNRQMKRINKTKPNASARVAKKPVEDIQQVGALAALGAIGTPTRNPSNVPVALNVNPNAGGAPALNSSGLIGTLTSKGGKLGPSGGLAGVKTKGKGFGTGTGYGVQGIKGSAGTRGVAGAVIGVPKLMQVRRDEGLTQKQVMAVVRRHAAKVQQCYERALLASPGLQGRVVYGWYISPSGIVKWAKVKNSSVRNADALNACVTKVFASMRFPKAKNNSPTQPTIGFPFGRM